MKNLLPPLIFVTGCANIGGASIEQSSMCSDYMDCVNAASPSDVGELLNSYGADGTCWQSEESAEQCTAACEGALIERYEVLADIGSDIEPECNARTLGLGVGSVKEVLRDGAEFELVLDPDSTCARSDYTQTVFSQQTPEGETVITMEGGWWIESKEYICEQSGTRMTCEPQESCCFYNDDNVLYGYTHTPEFNFTANYQSLELTFTANYYETDGFGSHTPWCDIHMVGSERF